MTMYRKATLIVIIDNRGGRRDWKRALLPVVMSRRMLITARPLRDDNTCLKLYTIVQLGPLAIYMVSCGLLARINLDLWLNQA